MASQWSKFVLLTWKNFLIIRRHPVRTLLDVTLPVLLMLFVVMVGKYMRGKEISEQQVFDPLPVGSINNKSLPSDMKRIAYSPSNAVLDRIVNESATMLGLRYEGFPNSAQMMRRQLNDTFLCGIDFGDSLKSISSLPSAVIFALRFPAQLREPYRASPINDWHTGTLVAPFDITNYDHLLQDGGPPRYWKEEFLPVQAAVSKVLAGRLAPNSTIPPIFAKRFAYPRVEKESMYELMENFVGYVIQFAFLYLYLNMTKYVTLEKEHFLKESMKTMGLPSSVHWSAWFVQAFALMLLPTTVVSLLIRVYIFTQSNWFLIWTYLLTYLAALIWQAFLISAFFDRATTATTGAAVLWILSSLKLNDDASFTVSMLSSLLANRAMQTGVSKIARLEGLQVGLQWNTIFTSTRLNDPYSFGVSWVVMLCNIFIYMLLTTYLEQVMPGKLGIAKPWHFPISFLFRKAANSDFNVDTEQPEGSKFFETEPESVQPGVRIRNLRKVYNGKTVAVDNLNLNLYQGQITALLGHNGAGKTTTMSMLTGLFAPSAGTALVNGYDIRKDIEGARTSLGLCFQHNVLFDELTVTEHLQFAASLKGVPSSQMPSMVDKYLHQLGLLEKADVQSSTLSGGLKRRLALGMALCGDPKVVLLDEPTTGVDPAARRELWDLLASEKHNKTILLSTHTMQEADELGDRVAILANGKLTAVGTPFFLKSAYGVGYRLICVKAEQCHEQRLLEELRKIVPDISIESSNASEVVVLLRKDLADKFELLLDHLDQQLEYCGITSYGISLTTLEEVFLKAGSDTIAEQMHPSADVTDGVPLDSRRDADTAANLLEPRHTGPRLFKRVQALLLKRLYALNHGKLGFLYYNFGLTILFLTIFGFPLNFHWGTTVPLKMSLDSYWQSVSFMHNELGNASIPGAYRTLFSESQRLVDIEQDMDGYILNKYNSSVLEYISQLLIGATFSEDNITAWFNAKALHSAPLALNLVYNSIVQAECQHCSIAVTNSPLPGKAKDSSGDVTAIVSMYMIIVGIVVTMAYVPTRYVLFYIKERTAGTKFLQYVSGLQPEVYWSVNFIWDFLVFTLTSLLILLMIVINQTLIWSTPEFLGKLLFVLLCYGFAIIPVVHLCSFATNDPATGYMRVLLYNVVAAVALVVLVVLLEYIDATDVASVLTYCFMFLPVVAFSKALVNLGTSDGTMIPIYFLFATGVLSYIAIWCNERKIFIRLGVKVQRRRDYSHLAPQRNIDSDVLMEKSRVSTMSPEEIERHSLVLRNLTKTYGNLGAVKWLSLATNHGECFGLLGINGAGKTTAFKMMTGDEPISFGTAWICGHNIETATRSVYEQIGYCPQFDALPDDLTGMQTIRIFALLHGVSISESLALADELGLTRHLQKPIRNYSGGNKRKLSTVVALIGGPSVLFLDEPTSGMDPGAKRQLWNVINRLRDSGRTIILTTHSMDECEALCTRLTIMAYGEFKCLGSIQHLKNKFSGGFILYIKVKFTPQQNIMDLRVAGVKQFIEQKFPDAVLKEDSHVTLGYHIVQSSHTWAKMFGIMEASKEALDIEEYQLGQTTLEQVFLFLSRDSSY